ncbi:MAG: hypothetical protein Faunusvirus5_6 [Faunusvirus sp.]|jgi:hypothetical protein|uniref:Ankyrin repeat protein n=1 Tax=Faunusvirus sp. TaxID=2487766 RepID=A0A3G4ZWB7_9VIRU|nr:MAG: hypothetical protein Faunusvirus5_6 [Faunusvirus sp.]
MISYIKQICTDFIYGSADDHHDEFMKYVYMNAYNPTDKCCEYLDQYDDFIGLNKINILGTIVGYKNDKLTCKFIDKYFSLPMDKINQRYVMSALFTAISYKSSAIAEILINKISVLQKLYPEKYNIDMGTDYTGNITALYHATNIIMHETVQQLVLAGANINWRNIRSQTPLLAICDHVIKELNGYYAVGTTIYLKDDPYINYPYINKRHYIDTIKCLVENGADLSIIDNTGNSIYDYAQQLIPIKNYLTTRYKNIIIDAVNYASYDNALYMCFTRCYAIDIIDIVTKYVV